MFLGNHPDSDAEAPGEDVDHDKVAEAAKATNSPKISPKRDGQPSPGLSPTEVVNGDSATEMQSPKFLIGRPGSNNDSSPVASPGSNRNAHLSSARQEVENRSRRASLIVPKKEKIRFLEELLIISVTDEARMQIRTSPSTHLVRASPVLTYSYPRLPPKYRSVV